MRSNISVLSPIDRSRHNLQNLINRKPHLAYVCEELCQIEKYRHRITINLQDNTKHERSQTELYRSPHDGDSNSEGNYAADSEYSYSSEGCWEDDLEEWEGDLEHNRVVWSVRRAYSEDKTAPSTWSHHSREGTEENDWLWQDKSAWPDAYRPDPGFSPAPLPSSDSETEEDENLIDGLYVPS